MDEEIIENLKDKKPIPKEMEIFIRKNGVRTGSRVFGGFKSGKSDIDIVLNNAKFPWNFQDLIYSGYYSSPDYRGDGYQSIYVNVQYSKHIHNLILVSKNYEGWIFATSQLKQIKNESEIMKELLKSKGIRVALFEILRERG